VYAEDLFVRTPLEYDLEPYDFLRIEGHVGKRLSQVLSNLKAKIKDNRLPIDVIALSLGSDASGTDIADPKALQGIQVPYDVLRNEVSCCLERQAVYWAGLTVKESIKRGQLVLDIRPLDIVFPGGKIGPVAIDPGVGAGGFRNVTPSLAANAFERAAVARVGTVPTATSLQTSAIRKGDVISALLGGSAQTALGRDYLKYQDRGDLDLSRIPPPQVPFGEAVISHHALQIVDQIGALLVLLAASDPLTLNVKSLTDHATALEAERVTFLALVMKELGSRKAFQTIKTYAGEARHPQVDAIAHAMPDLGEENAATVVQLLLNLSEVRQTQLISQLESFKGDRTRQVSILGTFAGALDPETLVPPPVKDVPVVEDLFLKELADRLQNFSCLCAIASFRKLVDLLAQQIAELKKSNLFPEFVTKHPGIQHKAGVTLGGTFIVVYDNELPEPLVVADFYLPYLCYSNQPPIVYQVLDGEPVPEQVSLSLPTLDFSVGDDTPHAFSHAPKNGTLTNGTPENGISGSSADTLFFTPFTTANLLEALPLADPPNFKLELSFTYVKKGVSSPELKVTVYKLPTASITPSPAGELPVGSAISLEAVVQFGEPLGWTVTDPTGQATFIEAPKLTDFPLSSEGKFTFRLEALQRETAARAIAEAVVNAIKVPDVPVRTCGNPSEIVEAYENLERVDGQAFARFDEVLRKLGISEYFEKLKDVLGRLGPGDDFATLEAPLPDWTKRLADGIMNGTFEDGRLLALEAYRVLMRLVVYLACLKEKDLSGAERKLWATRTKELTSIVAQADNLLDREKGVLAMLKADLAAERERQGGNAINPKPKYVEALDKLLGILGAF